MGRPELKRITAASRQLTWDKRKRKRLAVELVALDAQPRLCLSRIALHVARLAHTASRCR